MSYCAVTVRLYNIEDPDDTRERIEGLVREEFYDSIEFPSDCDVEIDEASVDENPGIVSLQEVIAEWRHLPSDTACYRLSDGGVMVLKGHEVRNRI